MRSKKIGDYEFLESDNEIRVDFKKSSKFWFDSILSLIIGLFFSAIAFLFIQVAIENLELLAIFAAFVTSFGAFLKLAPGILGLLKTSKGLLRIDKIRQKLYARENILQTRTICLKDIDKLIVSGHREFADLKKRRTRYYCLIKALLLDNSEIDVLIINTNRFLKISEKQLETELYISAKQIVTELNKALKTKHEWIGYSKL